MTHRHVSTLAIIGAGTMGTGIAITGLDAKLEVTLLEQDAVALQRGATRIREHYARRVAAGKVSADTAVACESRLHATTDWNALAQTDLVIEAVFEDLTVKREVFARLDKIAKPDAILATNTS
jgi:3-hydroxyacyl-CoA dehydrogenase